MCEFCTQHGEGKKWYLQAKNYSQELMNAERQQFMDDFLRDFEHYISSKTGPLDKMLAAQPEAVRRLFPKIIEQQKKEHWGQVVPIEEIEEILDMSLSVHRVSCVCRSALRGYREARFCFGIVSADSGKVSPPDYPDFSSDLEALSREDANAAGAPDILQSGVRRAHRLGGVQRLPQLHEGVQLRSDQLLAAPGQVLRQPDSVLWLRSMQSGVRPRCDSDAGPKRDSSAGERVVTR